MANGIALEADQKVFLANGNEVWVMDNTATAIEYSFDQEQWKSGCQSREDHRAEAGNNRRPSNQRPEGNDLRAIYGPPRQPEPSL